MLVEDVLTFDPSDLSFAQNVTAFPFQPCVANWVFWDGLYDLLNATALELSYTRCTPSVRGCVVCEPTRVDLVGFTVADDCETLALKYPDGEVRTYFLA